MVNQEAWEAPGMGTEIHGQGKVTEKGLQALHTLYAPLRSGSH